MTQMRLPLTSLPTPWKKNASTSAVTRSLLMLVLATTTTPLQWSPLRPSVPSLLLALTAMFSVANTPPTLLPLYT